MLKPWACSCGLGACIRRARDPPKESTTRGEWRAADHWPWSRWPQSAEPIAVERQDPSTSPARRVRVWSGLLTRTVYAHWRCWGAQPQQAAMVLAWKAAPLVR